MSGFSVFLVSVENGAGVNKMTNITYAQGGVKKPKYKNSKSTLHFLVAFYSLKTKNIGV